MTIAAGAAPDGRRPSFIRRWIMRRKTARVQARHGEQAQKKRRGARTSSRRTRQQPAAQLPTPYRAGSRKLEAGSFLEQVADADLDVAPVAALRHDTAEVGIGDVRVRSAQVRVVQEVEHLHAELHL